MEEVRKHYGLKPDKILKIREAAYGFVNAPRRWYERVREDLLKLGWTQNPHDECVIMKFGDAEITGLACFHVDDFIITDGGSSFERNFKLVKDLYERLDTKSSRRMCHHEVWRCGDNWTGLFPCG